MPPAMAFISSLVSSRLSAILFALFFFIFLSPFFRLLSNWCFVLFSLIAITVPNFDRLYKSLILLDMCIL